MNNNLKCNNDKSAGENSIVFRLFSVINGLVPKILAQQVTNLVNKFALLLHKYRFSKDCRNRLYVMSGDDKYEGRLFMFFPFLKLLNRMYHPGSSANELTLKAKDDNKRVLQQGRSMIEMLCVLAIIAVLSVGGIAGYSKAMEKFKVNKAVTEYSMIVFGLLEHRDDIKRSTQQTDLVDLAKSLNLIPNSWQRLSSRRITDDLGNMIQLFFTPGHMY